MVISNHFYFPSSSKRINYTHNTGIRFSANNNEAWPSSSKPKSTKTSSLSSLGNVFKSLFGKKSAEIKNVVQAFEEKLKDGTYTFLDVDSQMWKIFSRAKEENSLSRYLKLESEIKQLANRRKEKWIPPSQREQDSPTRAETPKGSISSVQNKLENYQQAQDSRRGKGILLDLDTAAAVEAERRTVERREELSTRPSSDILSPEIKARLKKTAEREKAIGQRNFRSAQASSSTRTPDLLSPEVKAKLKETAEREKAKRKEGSNDSESEYSALTMGSTAAETNLQGDVFFRPKPKPYPQFSGKKTEAIKKALQSLGKGSRSSTVAVEANRNLGDPKEIITKRDVRAARKRQLSLDSVTGENETATFVTPTSRADSFQSIGSASSVTAQLAPNISYQRSKTSELSGTAQFDPARTTSLKMEHFLTEDLKNQILGNPRALNNVDAAEQAGLRYIQAGGDEQQFFTALGKLVRNGMPKSSSMDRKNTARMYTKRAPSEKKRAYELNKQRREQKG